METKQIITGLAKSLLRPFQLSCDCVRDWIGLTCRMVAGRTHASAHRVMELLISSQ
ncbi:hypothetical protein ASPFODRAFT_47064 [Aspergillus luchuensis CBS 106.47]|uniref:Uncharacterized protein n=1 Tax=Aspergillus luchuensis (strain CBS 106.47) TaxID=1137211 RepID=A0A1M3TGZ8_ASPLC|nr:hypothetical protein ASPFODRAFT_47064 [Aspergillus luchuensis CBS 106.47]